MNQTKVNIEDLVGFRDLWFMVAAIPLIAFLMPVLFFKATLADGLVAYLPKLVVSFVYTVVYWLSVRKIVISMRCRFPNQQQTRRRVIYTAGAILIVFFIISYVLTMLHKRYLAHEDPPGVTQFDYNVASLTIIALVTTIYESVFFYDRWKRLIIEKEELKRAHVQSQLEGLKSQVNPHFLFNSLNTLTYLIPEDPCRAVTFVQKMSKVYRYILEIREAKLIPLREELQFLESYLFLLKERFGENLRIDMAIPESAKNEHIVPLSLQILLENAIKHNIISSEKPLTIRIGIDPDGFLVVQNNLQRKKQTISSTKVGLQNIRSRYAFFSGKKVEVIDGPEVFLVRIPMLNEPVLTER